MVNVPGGSKACGNCKRRKLKCDERHPTCRRCEKSKLVCDGYTSRPIKMYTSQRQQELPTTAGIATPATTISRQTPRVSLAPQRETIHLHFLSALIHKEVLENDIPSKWQPWVMAIIANEGTGVASQAASALAAVHFAALYDCSAQDMAFARMQYAGAIQTLSKNLVDDKMSHDVGNNAAVLFLFWCEIATGAMNGQAYAQHNEGLARLVEHIGPRGHQGWLARKNFMMSRMNIIFFALQQRRRTFLEHEDWKTTPWAKTWIPKTPIRERQNVDCNSSFRSQLLRDRILSTLHVLCRWRFEWHILHPNAACIADTESHFHRTLLQIESPTLPTSLWFRDFARAHEIAVYDAVLIVLLDLAERHVGRSRVDECISMAIRGFKSLNSPLLLPHPGITVQDVAEEVFRTVNYFLHGEHRASGALAVYYALWACQVTLYAPSNNDEGPGNSLWERLRLLVRSQSQ
ncbi:hypothetical protein M409DRAFT_26198 [Zasmidium cellare ATCC 36951]|uniref:Zn(2)-C6 fungal-type domain-containing protein n=1 Tax=Zasmidium cellare ATCC 36951 TaxID=1080233 RepID=A0A6A6CD24_ZASCE|nr:uncharacterized protein M409DRAFT_26198 [Zasmidium cellare ATCC 36951]KAF2163589.1 hypothetical protein M409DRAFT_26198 [Zasmidium cellare ATCC 36951]